MKNLKSLIIAIAILLLFPFGSSSQINNISPSDSLAPYEVPYVIGQAKEITSNMYRDINSLKGNISNDVKEELLTYIIESFEDSSSASIQSDLRYNNSLNTLIGRSPITLSKYLSDFETHAEITEIAFSQNSFRFTFPEKTAPFVFEFYGSIRQYFLNQFGDTLNEQAIPKLIRYIATKDQRTGRIGVAHSSVAILDSRKAPDFMEKEELEVLSQQFLKWRNQGGTIDNLSVMDDENLSKTLEMAQKKRIEKELIFEATLNNYKKAVYRGDVLASAEYFIASEKLQRGNPFLVSEKSILIEKLKEKIDNLTARTKDAIDALNYVHFSQVSDELIQSFEYWKTLNYQSHPEYFKTVRIVEDFTITQEAWDDLARRIESNTLRAELKQDLVEATTGKKCGLKEENTGLARFYALLGKVELERENGGDYALTPLNQAISCKSSFAVPKIDLLKLLGESATSNEKTEYYDNLIYYESKNPRYYEKRGIVHLNNGKIEEAKSDFNTATKYDPNIISSREKLVNLHFQERNWNESIKELEILSDLKPSQDQYKLLLAHAYMQNDNSINKKAVSLSKSFEFRYFNSDSKNLCDSLINDYRDSISYHMSTSMRLEEAANYFEKMMIIGGSNPEYYSDWAHGAECYYKLGNKEDFFERASVFADSAIVQSSGKSEKGLLIKGKVNRDLENFQNAKIALYELLEQSDDRETNFELGETYFKEGREFTVARIYFDRSLEKFDKKESNKVKYQTHIRIGQSQREEKLYKESLKSFKEASRIFKERGEPYYEMGMTYAKRNEGSDKAKSVKYFDKASKLGFNGYLSYSAKLESLFAIHQYKKIDEEYQNLGYQYMDDLTQKDWIHLAYADLFRGKFKESSKTLNTALAQVDDFRGSNDHQNLVGMTDLKKSLSLSMSSDEINRFRNRAQGEFGKSLQYSITDAQAYLGKSMAYYYQEDSSEYLPLLEKALLLGVQYETYQQDQSFDEFFKDKKIKKILKESEKGI